MNQAWFSFFSGFGAQTFWEDGYLLNFNSLVTAFAPLYYGIFEIDANPKKFPNLKKEMPILYKSFRDLDIFNYK